MFPLQRSLEKGRCFELNRERSATKGLYREEDALTVLLSARSKVNVTHLTIHVLYTFTPRI